MEPQQVMYSKSDAARQLGIGVSTLEKLIKQGRIPMLKLGPSSKNKVLVPAKALEELAAQAKVAGLAG
jgi:excisionase family DNA binding protein